MTRHRNPTNSNRNLCRCWGNTNKICPVHYRPPAVSLLKTPPGLVSPNEPWYAELLDDPDDHELQDMPENSI